MNEEVIIKVDLQGDGSVDKLNKKLDQTGEYSEKATSEIGRLRRELRDAKSDMLKYAEGTEQYNKALRRAAEIQGRVKETNDIVRAGVRDLGATTKLVAGTINGLAGGFQVAQGAMALFGVENDAVLKTMMQMQALMSITSGIAGFADGFDNLQDLMTGFKAQAGGAKDAVSELSKVSGEAADSMGNIAKEGAVIGSNLAGTTKIADAATDGFNKMKAANDAFINSIQNNEPLKRLRAEFELLTLQQKYAVVGSDEYHAIANKMQDVENEMSDIVENSTESIKEQVKATDEATVATEKKTKATEKSTSSLGKQLLVMGAWIAVIAAATYAIGALIEWLNKIPEDVKIKLELDTESLNKLKTDQDKIRKFALDYNKATKDGNKERIAELEKYAKKEFDVNADRLKAIKTNINGWREAFKEYLDIAKKTYYNEALSKKKAESEVNREIAKVAMESAKNEIRASGSPYAEVEINQIMNGKATRLFGAGKRLRDAIEEFNKANEEVKVLNKTAFIPIDMGTGTKPDGSGGTKSTYSPPSLKDTPEVVRAEVVARETIKWEEYKNAEMTRLEQEQLDISNEISNKKISLLGGELNVFEELEYDIRLTSAALKYAEQAIGDLSSRKAELEGYKSLFEEEAKNVEIIYNTIDKTNTSLAEKQNQLNALVIREKELEAIYNKSKNAGEASRNKATLESVRALIAAKNDEIETDKNQLTILQDGLTKAKERQAQYKAGSDEYNQIGLQIISLNNQIAASNEALHNSEVAKWREKISMAKEYLDAISNLAGGLADIAQGNMDLINAEYDQKIWANDEMIQSDEQREAKAYEIEMQRWEALKENFELQKKMKEAQAWMDFASGSVGIWTAPGITSLAPFGYILAGLQQAALLTSTIGNVKSIRAQQMLKPHKPSNNNGGSSAGINIGLNPAKDALTSRDENLNTMAKANINDIPISVVKVSEINDVQNKVKVRESNSSF